MLDDFSILLVLVIRPCRLDYALDPVYRTGDAIASDEFREVPTKKSGQTVSEER